MPSTNPTRVAAYIYAALGRPSQAVLPARDVHAARIEAGMEILRAIAGSPQNSFHGSLASLVTVAHNAFLPAHDGEPGIPVITPFSGGTPVDGTPEKPGRIDSYRADPLTSIYTGTSDGVRVAHDAADALGLPSPIAGRYSIVNGRLKFTGLSAQVPLIQLTRTMADTGVPEQYEPTVVKLAIPKLNIAGREGVQRFYAAAGERDLQLIREGSLEVQPVPNVELAQKAGVV